ncbi:glycosyltransferase [Yoonia algicola]|uniref:Glycosyltransferase n=1 Tax=Yoonia algicola TaxID=3137368 RepID=A0AAN0M680_9RHOB
MTSHPRNDVPWIKCVGELDFTDVMSYYEQSDALVFLSKAESYGLPLIEAIWLGKPIVCPDLPYAHTICGDGAIYFDPDSFASFARAIEVLDTTVPRGATQDWSEQRKKFPNTWREVAQRFVDISNLAMAEEEGRIF